MKINSISPEFDKKDLLHAIGATFGGVLRSEINENSCRLRVNLDVQRPLRRGIFVSTNAVSKVWVPFKYENLPMFYFGCGRLGHGLSNCTQLTLERKNKISENPPYSLALKAESKLFGKERIKFNMLIKKVGAQCSYTGGEMTGKEEGLMGLKEAEESKVGPRKKDQIKYQDKPNWKGTQPVGKIMTAVGEANMRKRKSFDVDLIIGHKENVDSARFKRLKHDNIGEWEEIFSEEMVVILMRLCILLIKLGVYEERRVECKPFERPLKNVNWKIWDTQECGLLGRGRGNIL
ncbi:hypothetical protein Gotur_029467 [Gossypium turneri]